MYCAEPAFGTCSRCVQTKQESAVTIARIRCGDESAGGNGAEAERVLINASIGQRRELECAAEISTAAGRVAVRVIRTDEELMIVRSVCRALELATAT